MKIAVNSYSAEWPILFDYEKFLILDALQIDDVAIEHIGSTAVPGLSAKPIIDILVGLPNEAAIENVDMPLRSMGYIYVKYYEEFVPGRKFFVRSRHMSPELDIITTQDDHEVMHTLDYTHNIHVVQKDGKAWKDYLKFRDCLRKNPADRLIYELLKTELKKSDWMSIQEYARAKTDFVNMILARD